MFLLLVVRIQLHMQDSIQISYVVPHIFEFVMPNFMSKHNGFLSMKFYACWHFFL